MSVIPTIRCTIPQTVVTVIIAAVDVPNVMSTVLPVGMPQTRHVIPVIELGQCRVIPGLATPGIVPNVIEIPLITG